MLFIPLIYFILLGLYFYLQHRTWNLDLAATSILIAISFCAIMIDVNDIYGDYGINEYSVTVPTVLLFCVQWTLVLIPFHLISLLKLEKHDEMKTRMLYTILCVVALNSFLMIVFKISDIKEAFMMDMVDVRNEHYQDMRDAGEGERNMLMLLPTIVISSPFPTFALFFWFYLQTFTKSSSFLHLALLISSIVQAVIAIIIAGRAALVYWMFDFYLLYSFFYQYLSRRIKLGVSIAALVLGALIVTVFSAITMSRFDDAKADHSAFDSLYGYAGQHINNFCAMFEYGANSPFQIDRIFPLTSKMMGHQFNLADHYDKMSSYVKAMVNVFDTFGAEIYLDLGWFGYIFFFLVLGLYTFYVKKNWSSISFHRVFIVIIMVAFYTRGIFAWPFTGHYSTMALFMMFLLYILFKYRFRLK